MSKKYKPYAAKTNNSRQPTLGPQVGPNHIYNPVFPIPPGVGSGLGDFDGDIYDYIVADPPKEKPILSKNFEILEWKGVYCLIEHKVLSIRKWVSSLDIDSEGIQNAFYDADQFFDPPD